MSVAAQMMLNQVVLGGRYGSYSGNYGSIGSKFKAPCPQCFQWFKSDLNDRFHRSKVQSFFDRILGVSEHQLLVRYGMVVHEVVPRVVERDWVDDFEDWIDNKFVPYLNGRVTVIPQKIVV